jgi:hypothetical protein
MDKYGFGAFVCTGLIAMETVAIYKGVDGAYFMPVVALVSGIVGAVLGKTISIKKITSINETEKTE